MAARAAATLLAGLLLAATIACGGGGGADQGSPVTGGTGNSPPVTPSPGAICRTDLAEAPPGLTVFGADAGDYLADRFSQAAADFNGDGLDDLLIGAPLADGPDNSREDAGEAYVILGSASPAAELDLAATAPGLTVYGGAAGDNLGFTVAAGDVNGDGTADVLVGARFAARQGLPSAGKVYIIYGSDGLAGSVDTALGRQDVTVTGAESGDFLGIALGSGDLNGDGTDDLAMGASGSDGPDGQRRDAGEVDVVLGSGDLPAEIDLAASGPDFTVYGATGGDGMPNRVATGDIDGDGHDELLLGTPFVDPEAARQDAGALYVVPFEEDGSVDLSGDDGFRVVLGATRKDQLGFNVAAGDFNGDGKDDILFGARDADGPGDDLTNSGEAHILFGGDLPQRFDLSRSGADTTVFGADAGDSLGFSVASGDVNGDGLADALVGAPIADSCGNARPDAGEAFVVLGRQHLPGEISLSEGAADFGFYGREEGDELGFSIAAGDFNGDGLDDVALGALQADGPDNGRQDSGEAYVIFSHR